MKVSRKNLLQSSSDLQKSQILKYRIDLSYIGSGFCGFQKQKNASSVQSNLESALRTLLRHPVTVQGASRTDSGVHAFQQVATFATAQPYSPSWLSGLNALTPRSLGAYQLQPVASDFDPTRHAKAKIYRYQIWLGRCFQPFLAPYVWSTWGDLDLKLLRQEARKIIGKHDFVSFCAKDSSAKKTVREVYDVRVIQKGPLLSIWFCGHGFLKQMVRILVGTLMEQALAKIPLGIENILALKDREKSGATAPAQGLTLMHVNYDGNFSLDDSFLSTLSERSLYFDS